MAAGQQRCPLCNKGLSRWTSLRRHIEDKHTQGGAHICPICYHVYRTKNSLHNHLSVYHRGATGTRGRRGRYPTYTVLRPTSAHQLAALKAAARHSTRDVPGVGQSIPRDTLASHHQLAAAPLAMSVEESDEPRELMQQAAGGFESLLQSDADVAAAALHQHTHKNSAPQSEFAVTEIVDE